VWLARVCIAIVFLSVTLMKLRTVNDRSFATAVATTLSAVILANGNIWPWYLVWIAPFLALAGDAALWRIWLPLLLALPFAQVFSLGRWAHGSTAIVGLYGLIGLTWFFGKEIAEQMAVSGMPAVHHPAGLASDPDSFQR
jgi:hypothetical protein